MQIRTTARFAGLLYLIVIATGLFAEAFVREAVTVPGNAAATVHNILTSEMRYRLGFVADLINLICGLPVIVFFYRLFKPVHKNLMLLAVFFVIISNAVMASNLISQMQPLLYAGTEPYLKAFQPGQLATLSVTALSLQELGYGIALVFFGCYCIITGYLIYKTRFLPRILGVLYAIAGLCYIINSLTMFLNHNFENPLFPYILIPSFTGELCVCLWLLIMGVKDTNHLSAWNNEQRTILKH